MYRQSFLYQIIQEQMTQCVIKGVIKGMIKRNIYYTLFLSKSAIC